MVWQVYTWYWDQYSLVQNWYYLNSLPGYWYKAGIAWDQTSLTSFLIQRPILVYILGFQPSTPPNTGTNSKPIFTPFSNLYFIQSRVGWIFVVLVRLCGELSISRVKLPITNHYLIINHFFRFSWTVLHFEWFNMLWECYLKL